MTEAADTLQGFSKRLPDDCVEYSIYILDQTLNDSTIRERLSHIKSTANLLTGSLLKGFIWQRDSFGLELVKQDGTSHLHGRTNYGDSVEDEWLIVYLLKELSETFPDIWVRIVDTDGEFLLIEAANSIPQWLNPEIADNRVWLNKGQLFIIDACNDKDSPADSRRRHYALTFQEACTCIRGAHPQLLHSGRIEAEAFYRLRNYPKQIKASLHHALVNIPRKLAYILHQDEAYISPAVEAFYLRDPVALRPLQNPNQKDLNFPPVDLVTVSVKFSKVGFAQIKSQQFACPAAWTLAMSTAASKQSKSQAELGMRITCGFEMLVTDPYNQDRKAVREIKLFLEDISSGEDRLPSDTEISSWESIEDDEAWLDINFQDFEDELSGKTTDTGGLKQGFGDKSTHENLRKVVARFEEFLNDDAAGSEGAEYLDDMDNDNDEDEDNVSEGLSSEVEDERVCFDEAEFARMMGEMIGMPSDTGKDQSATKNKTSRRASVTGEAHACTTDIPATNKESEILLLQQALEAELKAAGALQLTTVALPSGTTSQIRGEISTVSREEDLNNEDEDGDDLHIDYNLAKNMLQSFKSQAGMAGPGSNLIGLMGMRLPRDEGETP